MSRSLILLTLLLVLISAFASASPHRRHRSRAPHPRLSSVADPISPDVWCLTFATDESDAEPIEIEISRALAPLGADHLYALVNEGFYSSPAAFFRVVPQFIVQFGISGSPELNTKYGNTSILDDPVVASNTIGTLTYATAGPDTRTTQLFINFANNSFLDSQGFSPFGTVVNGLNTAINVFNPTPNNSDGVDQGNYTQFGQSWIEQQYPGINSITGAKVQTGSCAK